MGTATNWIFNFMVVEITPIGIQNLQWQFYIVWTVLNASFVPIIYFLYPETADRSLEDIDDYYRTNPSLLVFRDRDATSSKRPEKYKVREEEEVRRNSSVDPAVLRRGSRVSASGAGGFYAGGGTTDVARQRHEEEKHQEEHEEDYEGRTEAGDVHKERVMYKEDV